MAGKSQHARRKLSRKEKQKRRIASLAGASRQPVAAQTYEPVAPAKVSTPSAGTPDSGPARIDVHYPYIASELCRIGILAGVMLAILIILSLVLP